MAEGGENLIDKLVDRLLGWKASVRRLRNEFGTLSAVILLLLFGLALIWWNWDDISRRPGVNELLSQIEQSPIPEAKPGVLTIALARLGDDKGNYVEKFIEGELYGKEDFDIVKIDREIPMHSFSEERRSREYAVNQAKDILLRTRADILLWGEVILIGNSIAIRLNWTMANNMTSPKVSEKYEINSLSLPPMFYADLKDVIGLILKSKHTINPPAPETNCSIASSGEQNKIVCNFGLTPEQLRAVTKAAVEGATAPLVGEIGDVSKTLGVNQEAAKTLLRIIGEQENIPDDRLTDAVSDIARDYVKLKEQVAALNPDRAQSLVQQARSEIEGGKFQEAHELLEQAIRIQIEAARGASRTEQTNIEIAEMLNAASTVAVEANLAMIERNYIRGAQLFGQSVEYVPDNNLTAKGNYLVRQASAFYLQGYERGDNGALRNAIEIYSKALANFPRSQAPLDWAGVQNDLGNAFRTLGERQSEAASLNMSIAAYRSALEVRTREYAPLDWAQTENNLGLTLQALGERESGTERLDDAVAAYRAALEVRTRERAPLDWAATQNNLGTALQMLGERGSGTERIEEAVSAYRVALEERTRARAPVDWAATQTNLGNALAALGERASGTARLKDAVAAYQAALEERTRDRVPLDWASTQNDLGNALSRLGKREGGTAQLDEAVAAYRAALGEQTRERVPLEWALTQNNLGEVLTTLAGRESGVALLDEAVVAYRSALAELTKERAPFYHAQIRANLEQALTILAKRTEVNSRKR